MWSKRAGKRLYQKAPAQFLLTSAKRLQHVAMASFVLSFLFILLSNPFSAYQQLKDLPASLTEAKKVLATVPDFIQVFPSETEKNSFAFFDWTKEQLDSWPIFAKEGKISDETSKEAGQSAVTEQVIDYASLPFFIEIPSLNLYEEVQANVDPNDASEYQAALEQGVAHALNSAFPGQHKMIYIFGHSTDGAWNVEAYNAVFYQIKDLAVGDQIILHLADQQFVYQVSRQDIVSSKEVNFINQRQNQDILILQTCWPPGTSWQRLFVTAVPVTE